MPQVPVFQNDVIVHTPGAAVARPQAFAAPYEALARGAGELTDRLADLDQRYRQARQQADAATATAGASKQLRDLEFKWSQVPDRDAASKGFDAEAAQLKTATLKGISDPVVQNYVGQRFDEEALSRSDSAAHSAFKLEGERRQGELITNLSSYAQGAATAANGVEFTRTMNDAETAIKGAVDAGWISAEAGAKARLAFHSDVQEAQVQHALNGAIAADDAGTASLIAEELNDGKIFEGIAPEKREALGEHAETIAHSLAARAEARQREQDAMQRGQVRDRYDDNLASLERTGIPVGPLSNAEIRSAFPEAEANDMIRRLRLAGGLYQAQRSTALTSPQEDQALIAKWQPQGAGFADQARAQDALGKALDDKYKALDRDPAAYVIGVSPDIRAAFTRAAKDPVQTGAAVAALNSAYDKLGLPSDQRPVMPATQAQAFVSAIVANPEKAPATMKTLQAQYGNAWPQAWRDLTTLGKLPSAFQAVPVLDNERDGAVLARWLAQAPKGKTADDLFGAKAVNDIKANVRSDPGVQSLLSSLSRSGASTSQVDGVLDAIDNLGFAKAFYDRDPRAALNAASSFTGKYEFMPNGGARVPRDRFDAVSANAFATLSTLSLDNVSVPPIYGKAGMPKQEEFLDLLKASPTWITSPNADGLLLMDAYGRLVRDKRGEPISVPFDQQAPASNNPFDAMVGGVGP